MTLLKSPKPSMEMTAASSKQTMQGSVHIQAR